MLLLLPLPAAALSQRAARLPAQYPDYYRVFLEHQTEGFLTRAVLPTRLPVIIEEHPTIPLAALVTAVRLEPSGVGLDLALAAESLTRRLDRRLRVRGGWSEWEPAPGRLEIRTILPAEEILHAVEAHLEIWTAPDTADVGLLQPAAEFVLSRFQRRFPAPWAEMLLRVSGASPDAPPAVPPGALEEAAAAAYQRWFRPESGVLGICGSIRHEVVLRKLAEAASGGNASSLGRTREGIPPGAPAARAPAAAAETRKGPETPLQSTAESRPSSGFHYVLFRGEPAAPLVILGFLIPPSGHPDRLALELVRCLLAEGESAYLKLPRDGETGSPFAIRSGYASIAGQDLLLFVLRPDPQLLERAEMRILGALEALRTGPIPGLLMKRAQAWLVTGHLRRLETQVGRAAELVRWELLGGYGRRDRFPSEVAALSEADLRQVISRYLRLDRLTVIELLPDSAGPREFTPESFLETVNILSPAEAAAEMELLESLRGEVQAYRPPRWETSFADIELRRSSVLRGPEVFVRELHTVPLADLALFYPGGRPAESADRAGLTELLIRALVRHLARVEGGRRWLDLEAAGAQIRPEVGADYFGFHLLLPSTEMATVFRQVMEWLKAGPRPGEAELKEALLELEADVVLDDNRCSPPANLLRRTAGAVFGNHPYGVDASGCGRQPSFSLEALENWRESFVQEVYPHVLVVGDVSGTSFLQDQIPLLSDRSFRTGKAVAGRPQTAGQPGAAESPEGLGVNTWAGPRVSADEVEILDVALALLNGPAGRLNRHLAESGLGGGAWLARESFVGAGLLHLVVASTPGRQEAARRLALEAIRGLAEANVPQPEFLSALVRTITRFTHLQHVRDNYLRETMTAILAEEPIDYARRYVLNIRQMRMGEIETAVRRSFGEGR